MLLAHLCSQPMQCMQPCSPDMHTVFVGSHAKQLYVHVSLCFHIWCHAPCDAAALRVRYPVKTKVGHACMHGPPTITLAYVVYQVLTAQGCVSYRVVTTCP